MSTFTPSPVPGCRTPHVWLDDGRSLYDAVGPWFTLLRLDASTDPSPLLEAAKRQRVPVASLDLRSESAKGLYRHKLVLSRPDQVVAWRGNECPAEGEALMRKVVGYG